jgi:RimJ/RimL family protein N-acetyltransferase
MRGAHAHAEEISLERRPAGACNTRHRQPDRANAMRDQSVLGTRETQPASLWRRCGCPELDPLGASVRDPGRRAPQGDANGITRDDAVSFSIRKARPDDEARLARFFQGLSPRSRHQRFLAVINELPAAVIKRFVERNTADEMSLFAVMTDRDDHETLIGEARYARADRSSRAEFALAIADAAQAMGIGRCLLRALMRYARANGIETLFGDVLPENQGMLALAHELGFAERRDQHDARLRYVERPVGRAAEPGYG